MNCLDNSSSFSVGFGGINQGQFQYFSEIIKSESVGLRAMVGAQSGLFSHGGAWGQPSWSPVSSGEAWPELLNT